MLPSGVGMGYNEPASDAEVARTGDRRKESAHI